jgi:hypothetical protein
MQDPAPTAPGGLFAKDRFDVDIAHDTVTCPAGVTVAIRRRRDGGGIACFGEACNAYYNASSWVLPEPALAVTGGGGSLPTLLRLVPGDRGGRIPALAREHDLK